WRRLDPEHGAGIHEDRRPQSELTRARAERDLELSAAQIERGATERIVLVAAIVQRKERCRAVIVDRVEPPYDARADPANVEAADLRLAQEEPVGQPNIVASGP